MDIDYADLAKARLPGSLILRKHVLVFKGI